MSATVLAVDTAALRRAIGAASPDWYGAAFSRAFYRALGGGATVASLDRIAVTLGMHYTELVERKEDGMMPELDTTPVRIDPERLLDLSAEWREEHPVGKNSSSQLSRLIERSSLSWSQLEGRENVARWKVESLAVLIGCLPQALIAQGSKTAPKPKSPKPREETTVNGTPWTPWTSEDDELLRKWSHLGKSGAAEKLGRTASSVQNRAVRLGISLTKREPGPEPSSPKEHRNTEAIIEAVAPREAPVIEGAIEPEDFSADEPVEERECVECAPQTHCSDEVKCRADLEHTPCGADPCELVADAEPARKPETAFATVNVHLTDLPAVKGTIADQALVMFILAERITEMEGEPALRRLAGYRKRSAEEVLTWAHGRLMQRRRADFRERMAAIIDDIEARLFGG